MKMSSSDTLAIQISCSEFPVAVLQNSHHAYMSSSSHTNIHVTVSAFLVRHSGQIREFYFRLLKADCLESRI